MNVNIVPKVEFYGRNVVTATTSRTVSTSLWKITDELKEDDNVYSIQRRQADTQISFMVNPGYELNQVHSVIVPAAYLAATWNGTAAFWPVGLDEHLRRMTEMVKFNSGILPADAKDVFSQWIFHEAKEEAGGLLYALNHTHLLPSFTSDRISKAHEALRRLSFTNPWHTAAGIFKIKGYIKEVEDYLPVLHADDQKLKSINREINDLIQKAVAGRDFLYRRFDVNTLATPDLCALWLEHTAFVKMCIETAEKLVENFDENKNKGLMDRIHQITPPVDTK